MTDNIPCLLPNASELEKKASQILQQAVRNPIIIADLINPDRCPVELLPYLAWAFSVDRWEENWAETLKRAVIKQAFFVHKHKGTLSAIKRVIEPIGYLVDIQEWFNQQPMGQAGTFSLTVAVPENGINAETYNELVRLINDAKPVSRHLINLTIAITPTGDMNVFIGQYSGEIIRVYPQ